MQIYEALKKDHQEVRGLLAQLVRLDESDKTAARSALIQAIRDALVPHSRAEETVFYNSLRETAGAADLVMHSYQEHLEAETLLRSLQVADRVDAGWLKMANSLKTALEHHISEE
jgi:hemerythrin superfamily protein